MKKFKQNLKNLYSIKNVIHLLCIILLLSACESKDSSDVNQDKISISYQLTFSKTDDKTYAKAYFNFGLTNLELTTPSKLRINGHKPRRDDLFNYYEYVFSGSTPEATFEWTDADEKVYTNILKTVPITITSISDKIDTTKAFIVTWDGDAIDDKTTLSVRFVRPNVSPLTELEINLDSGAKTISISGNGLAQFMNFPTRIELKRKVSGNLKERTQESCTWTTEYIDSKTIQN